MYLNEQVEPHLRAILQHKEPFSVLGCELAKFDSFDAWVANMWASAWRLCAIVVDDDVFGVIQFWWCGDYFCINVGGAIKGVK